MHLPSWNDPTGWKLAALQTSPTTFAALWTIDRNEEFIKLTLAVLMTPD
ncbi:hypothetical protein LZV00_05560 [Pseudomonas kielensis]|jgi:hypothetical protein|nr:hypothetical protein [Pseudomonas kielensis]UZM16874.1 hypothetical protein LZV00_05560 [Pseudomonas kielensis]